MNYFEYEEKAATTACYNEKVALSYVTLGLCSEMGETYEKINNEAETEEISKEIGDMFWYLAMIRKECNLDIEGWDWKESLANAEGAWASAACTVLPSPFFASSDFMVGNSSTSLIA